MKTATFLFLLLIPLSIFSQRGYCPCMEREKKNEGIDLTEVLQQIDQQQVDLNTANRVPATAQTILVGYHPEPAAMPPQQNVAPPPQQQLVQSTVSAPPTVETPASTVSVRSESSRNSLQQRKKKKRKRVRLRARKKAKKYRGGCPVFKNI